MPLGVLINGEVKELNSEAEGKPKGLQPDKSWVEDATIADVQIAGMSSV